MTEQDTIEFLTFSVLENLYTVSKMDFPVEDRRRIESAIQNLEGVSYLSRVNDA